MNKVILIGNIGREPEIKSVGESQVAKFSLATTSPFKDKQGNKVTQWHNITAWGKLAEIAEKYAKKGDKIAIEGRIEYREYEKDGVKKTATEIVAENLELIGGAKKKDEDPLF
jgi:single-strand DNA-binding protein